MVHGISAPSTQGATISVVRSAVLAKAMRKESASHLLPEQVGTAQQEFVGKFIAVIGSLFREYEAHHFRDAHGWELHSLAEMKQLAAIVTSVSS